MPTKPHSALLTRALLIAGGVAAIALAVAGCSSGPSDTTPTTAPGGGSTATPVGPETPTPSSGTTPPASASEVRADQHDHARGGDLAQDRRRGR